MFYALVMAFSIVSIQACQNNRNTSSKNSYSLNKNDKSISQLETRLKEIENFIENKFPPVTSQDLNAPTGPIKSLTFRIGSNDDRLRIYWENGSYSDLPCTKEQSTWACG